MITILLLRDEDNDDANYFHIVRHARTLGQHSRPYTRIRNYLDFNLHKATRTRAHSTLINNWRMIFLSHTHARIVAIPASIFYSCDR